MAMAERIMFEVIKEGLEWFQEKPERFERFLTLELELGEEEAADAKVFFNGGVNADGDTIEPHPPTVVHGYPHIGGPVPCWAISLGSESISTDFLGHDIEFLDTDGERYFDPESGNVVDPKGRRFQYRFDILVLAEHPDVTLYYYHLLKRILMSRQTVLESRHVENMGLEGADLAPDARYLPDDIFARRLSVTVEREETWTEAIGDGPVAARVTGIFGPNEDQSQDVAGDVDEQESANITTYNTGAE